MPTWSKYSTRMTWGTGFKISLGVSRTTRQSASRPGLCPSSDTSNSQVPHTPVRALPAQDHCHRLLHSYPTDCRWHSLVVLGCSIVAVGAVIVTAYPSNPYAFFTRRVTVRD